MKRSSVARRLSVMVAVLGVVGSTPAQASVGTVFQLGKACITTPTAKFAPAPDGMVRGFVESGCTGDSIDFVSWQPQHHGKVAQQWRTPYVGQVLATAQDDSATYLLYRDPGQVEVGKVMRDGTASRPVVVSVAAGGGLEGSIAAFGGHWYAVWTEPKAGGGFAMHSAAAGSSIKPTDRVLPAGAGVDDSAPDIARIGAVKHSFLLAFARHTASGYHLLVAHRAAPWAKPRELDVNDENPQPAVARADVNTVIAWVHGNTIRLATTATGKYNEQSPLHQEVIPQPTNPGQVGAPQAGYACGKIYVAFTKGGENSGEVWVDVLSQGAWARHLVRVARTAAPVLAGVTPRCGAAQLEWTEAGRLLSVKV